MDLLLLQASPNSALFGTFIFPLLIMLVVYFFMIRPTQAKQRKLIESLQPGQEIVLNSGIIGKITSIDGEILTLAVDDKTRIRVLRNAVSSVHTK